MRQPTASRDDRSTTVLGSWYATILFWKPQVALFVSETTLLPVLVALAPAASVIERFSTSLEDVLGRHALNRAFIEAEVAQMTEHRLATTRNRSVVGVMNEFARLGAAYRHPAGVLDLGAWSVRLSETPCGPLSSRQMSPDREVAALVAQHPG